MSNSTAVLQLYRAEDFLSAENLDRIDAAVTEIFTMMFGFDIRAVDLVNPECPSPNLDERTAIVGFSGSMRARYICAEHVGHSGRTIRGAFASVYSENLI